MARMTDEERQYEAMQQQLASIQQAIAAYNRDPNMFTQDEVKQLKQTADAMGIPFEVDFSISRAVKKGLYELGEGATLGLLPNSLDPGALNTGESLAGFAGGLLGLAVPGFGAFKAGKAALRGAGTLARGEGFFQGTGTLANAVAKIPNKKLRIRLLMALRKANVATEGAVAQGIGQTALKYPRTTQLGVGVPTFLALNRALEEDQPEQDLYAQY